MNEINDMSIKIFSAVSGNEAENLLSHLNSVEPSIQFTLEREKDRHFPFLDLNVSRGVQGNLETSVYHKPTPTDKYLAFHPICHKKVCSQNFTQEGWLSTIFTRFEGWGEEIC